jgi:rubrerythrin
MFESPFNTSNSNNLFSSPVYDSNSRLNELYKNMELLKQNQQNPQQVNQKTVFSDISEELKNISEDEKRYLESSEPYIMAFQGYQTGFSMFLIERFGNEFSSSPYGKSAEEFLATIKKQKEEYKNRFAKNITEIKEKNDALASQNNELAKVNQSLQAQLLEIQKKLGGLVENAHQ